MTVYVRCLLLIAQDNEMQPGGEVILTAFVPYLIPFSTGRA
jgi:hypothetical protein